MQPEKQKAHLAMVKSPKKDTKARFEAVVLREAQFVSAMFITKWWISLLLVMHPSQINDTMCSGLILIFWWKKILMVQQKTI